MEHLQPQNGLKTSSILTCIGFIRGGNFRKIQLNFGEKIGFVEFYTSSGAGTGMLDRVSQHLSHGSGEVSASSGGSLGIVI